MMSLFIYGMEMPKQNDTLVVREINGKVYIKHEGHYGFEGRIVEVKEPHGDLVDKDKLMKEFIDRDLDHLQRDDWKEVIQIVSDANVIIKTEGSEE